MKKYLALTLVTVMALLLLAACGGKSKIKPVKLEFEIAAADTLPEGWLCVVDRGDAYLWKDGVTDYAVLYETYDLNLDQSTYINVFVPDNQTGDTFKCYMTKDSVRAWFAENFQDGVTDAYNEYRNAKG
jgi:hypothetical protein